MFDSTSTDLGIAHGIGDLFIHAGEEKLERGESTVLSRFLKYLALKTRRPCATGFGT
jgi:hypothetical protein